MSDWVELALDLGEVGEVRLQKVCEKRVRIWSSRAK